MPSVYQAHPPQSTLTVGGVEVNATTRIPLWSALDWASGLPPAVLTAHPPLPLAVGIHDAVCASLAAPEAQRTRVRAMLRVHSRSWAYLRSVAADGSERHDIEGLALEVVADDHRAYARDELERMRSRKRAPQSEQAPPKPKVGKGGRPILTLRMKR